MADRTEMTEAEMIKEKNYSLFYSLVFAYIRGGTESLDSIGYFLEENNISYGYDGLVDGCISAVIQGGEAALMDVFVAKGLDLFDLPFRVFAEAFRSEKYEICEKLCHLFLPELEFKRMKKSRAKYRHSVCNIGLKPKVSNRLRRENIHTVGDLVRCTKDDLLQIENFGNITVDEIEFALSICGLSLLAG